MIGVILLGILKGVACFVSYGFSRWYRDTLWAISRTGIDLGMPVKIKPAPENTHPAIDAGITVTGWAGFAIIIAAIWLPVPIR